MALNRDIRDQMEKSDKKGGSMKATKKKAMPKAKPAKPAKKKA